jgi:uncharacterized protein (TIGR02147 family)
MDTDYRDILKNELAERVLANPSYTASSFAKKLNIDKSYLSLILNKKRNLGLDLARDICKVLMFEKDKAEFFKLSVELSQLKSEESKRLIKQKLKASPFYRNKFKKVGFFKLISDWEYSAIFESINLDCEKIDAKKISKVLNLPLRRVKTIIKELVDLELVYDGGDSLEYRESVNLVIPGESDDLSLRKFHLQILNKIQQSLLNESFDARSITGTTLAINSKNLCKYKKLIERFHREIISLSESENEKNEIFQLEVALVNMKNI